MLGNSETILPMSDEPTDLLAVMSSGIKVFGECDIDSQEELPDYLTLSQDVNAAPGVVQAIESADMLIIGPGSLITSVMPAMLVEDIAKAVQQTSACQIYLILPKKPVQLNRSICNRLIGLKACGYRFCDMSISLDALSEIVSHFDDVVKSPNQQHDIEQLSNVLAKY